MGQQVRCSHMGLVQKVAPNAEGCRQCLDKGDTWVTLRMCMTCGNVGCCDDSKNKHATKHSRATQHPIMRSFQPGEDWMWCYVDKILIQ